MDLWIDLCSKYIIYFKFVSILTKITYIDMSIYNDQNALYYLNNNQVIEGNVS